MECVRRIIKIILVFEFKLYVEYQARYWPSKFYKKVLSLSPGAWKFEGSWVRSQLWLQAYIIYTIKITFKFSFPMAQELFANSVFYRNKHKYTVVRRQCNKTGPFGPNHIFFIKSLILGVHEWIYNYFDCFLLKKSFKMAPLLSTCDQ